MASGDLILSAILQDNVTTKFRKIFSDMSKVPGMTGAANVTKATTFDKQLAKYETAMARLRSAAASGIASPADISSAATAGKALLPDVQTAIGRTTSDTRKHALQELERQIVLLAHASKGLTFEEKLTADIVQRRAEVTAEIERSEAALRKMEGASASTNRKRQANVQGKFDKEELRNRQRVYQDIVDSEKQLAKIEGSVGKKRRLKTEKVEASFDVEAIRTRDRVLKETTISEDKLNAAIGATAKADRNAITRHQRKAQSLEAVIQKNMQLQSVGLATADSTRAMGAASRELILHMRNTGVAVNYTEEELRQFIEQARIAQVEFKEFGVGVAKRGYQAQLVMQKISSAAQGAMLGMSAMTAFEGGMENLSQNILGLGFSFIFLQFAMVPVAAAFAGIALLVAKLTKDAAKTKKINATFRELQNILVVSGQAANTASIRTAELHAQARLLWSELGILKDAFETDIEFMEDFSQAAGSLAFAGLEPTTKIMRELTIVGAATGRKVSEIASAFMGVINPADIVIGDFESFESAMRSLIPVAAGLEGKLDLIGLFSEIAGVIDPGERALKLTEILSRQFGESVVPSLQSTKFNVGELVGELEFLNPVLNGLIDMANRTKIPVSNLAEMFVRSGGNIDGFRREVTKFVDDNPKFRESVRTSKDGVVQLYESLFIAMTSMTDTEAVVSAVSSTLVSSFGDVDRGVTSTRSEFSSTESMVNSTTSNMAGDVHSMVVNMGSDLDSIKTKIDNYRRAWEEAVSVTGTSNQFMPGPLGSQFSTFANVVPTTGSTTIEINVDMGGAVVSEDSVDSFIDKLKSEIAKSFFGLKSGNNR